MDFYDKSSIHQILIKPIKMFGFPKAKDKLEALNKLRNDADLGDINYIFPLILTKNATLVLTAAQIVAGVMNRIEDKAWNRIYDQIKYTKIDEKSMVSLLDFEPNITIHLLGVASLNSSGYVREKALKLISGVKHPSAIPYVLLRLNDWVRSIRNLAEHILKNMLTADNISLFINYFALINRLQNSVRVDLKNIKKEIIDFLKDDLFSDIIVSQLKHPQVKTRLFCYELLKERIVKDDKIITYALQDKSFEVRMWLVQAISVLEPKAQYAFIEKLIHDKSAKVKTAVLREYEDVVCLKFRDRLEGLLVDENASVREEARFIVKKRSIIIDIPEFYRQQILRNPIPGVILGLGETGEKRDFDVVCSYRLHEEIKIRLAALMAMWHLSPVDALGFVMDALNSDIPKIRKTVKRLLKRTKMPEILSAMKEKLRSEDHDISVFALRIICGYGGWQALEAILYTICNKQETNLSEAKNLLNSWLNRATSLYSRPDRVRENTISSLFEVVRQKGLISERTIKELQFAIATWR